jgi:hypothetical protein
VFCFVNHPVRPEHKSEASPELWLIVFTVVELTSLVRWMDALLKLWIFFVMTIEDISE